MTEFPVPAGLERAYQLIQTELNHVTDLLGNTLRHYYPEIDAMVRYSFLLGGKRLRPVLLLLVGKATGGVTQEHIRAAAALEMIHTASLVHDDILDGATFRRHLATINAEWDPKSAVLVGDLLLAQAMLVITPCNDINVYRLLSHACFTTCEGELLQTTTRSRFDMDLAQYRAIIAGKTAALLECACRLGAHLSGAESAIIEEYALFGQRLGMSFQIIDDILDLVGNEESTGKTLGTDIINHKPTLPLIHYLSHCGAGERTDLLAILASDTISADQLAAIRTLLKESGSIAAARAEADQLLTEAVQQLDKSVPVATQEQKASRLALEEIAQFVQKRNH
ncbi:MAG: polyprenyl synthetase family protein [Planctomycetia bacterium]|nr:polyprenyl synthetase family protein [Planctomycetia bacterium]